MAMPLGLRERKKQRTRETIARAALALFDAQGFRATTIAEIAEAADVAPRTVSAYFPAKEDLVFPDQDEICASLERRLTERRP
jgi:AcrR family transcriptional regulator